MMIYTQIILDIHPNSFIQNASFSQNSAFFEPQLCSQPTKCRFPYIFVISDKQGFISQLMKVVGPLTEKFTFLILLGIQIEIDFNYKHQNQAPLFQSFKTIPEQRKSET